MWDCIHILQGLKEKYLLQDTKNYSKLCTLKTPVAFTANESTECITTGINYCIRAVEEDVTLVL